MLAVAAGLLPATAFATIDDSLTIASMPANIKRNPLIDDMQKGMLEIRPLVGLGGEIS